MRQAPTHVRQVIEPVVTALGYELVGVEYASQGRAPVLRIYIDSADGISLDDCQRVSHQVSGVLDVENPIQGRYDLEVSSPGLDRPLFNAQDFARFAGQRAKIQLHAPLNGRRNFTGVLHGVRDDCVVIEDSGAEFALPLSGIDKARLAPEWGKE
ncbi:MAG: ribosome maturation factor RimP [Pseudomonadota bacterium]